jgi:hypothetical protein
MRLVVWKSRALAMGMVCAVVGFCYGVSTTDTVAASGHGVGARAVGSTFPLRFTNPELAADEFDLGDACFGSAIVRYVTAEGGLKPYRFTSVGTNSFSNAIAGFNTDLQLGLSGLLAGSVPPGPVASTTFTGAPGFRFQVTVQDAKGTNVETKTGFFNLFLVDCDPNAPRFAVDSIPSARLAESYVTKVEVIGGKPEYVFSLVSISGVAKIEDLGLSLTRDGAIIGKPLRTGSFTLVVRCVDGLNRTALSRSGAGIDQSLTLVVSDNPITSSDVATTQCSIRGNSAQGGKDSLKYKGYVNMLGQDNFTLLNSQFRFNVGGIAVTGRLDQNGRFNAVLLDGSKVKIKASPSKGTVDIAISNGTFTAALGFLPPTPPVPGITRRAVHVSLGDAVAASEVLDFDTDVNGSRYRLEYRLGRTGTNAGGAFQIVSVKGKDGTTISGQPGDKWKVGFIAAARAGVTTGGAQGLDAVTAATIRIGTNFSQNLTGLRSNGQRTTFSGGGVGGVRKFVLDGKRGTGKLDTNVISIQQTGITQAISAPTGNRFFPLGVDITRSGAAFSGEHARRIFGLKNTYSDRPAKR